MKVFVTGATGVLGRSAVPLLVGAGHEVRAVARRDDAATALRETGADPVVADLFDLDAVKGVVDGCDAVLHLATNIPPLSRAARRRSWLPNNRLRTEATRNLVAAAEATGATRVVKESITFTYLDRGDEWIDESAPTVEPIGLLGPTLEGEQLALGFAERGGGTAVVLRFGLFYGGVGNRNTADMLLLARFGRSTVAGAPGAFMSSVHVDDTAAAVVAALDVPTGTYNVCDDEPLTRRAHLDAFAAAFGTRVLRPTPAWVLRRVGGEAAAGLLASQRVTNRRFRDAARWAPQYPNARVGWMAVAASEEERNRA